LNTSGEGYGYYDDRDNIFKPMVHLDGVIDSIIYW
jgi:hypothetical protein